MNDRLNWDVFVTKRQGLTRDLPPGKEQWMWVPTSSTLIYGQRDAVLADALLTVELTHALVEWVAASGKNLTTIDVTHGHGIRKDLVYLAEWMCKFNVLVVVLQQLSVQANLTYIKAEHPLWKSHDGSEV